MQQKPTARPLALAYLWIAPLLFIALGFALAPIRYRYYIPLWTVHAVIVVVCLRALGMRWKADGPPWHGAAFFLLFPWLPIALFAGFGPPPDTAEGWAATAFAQQVRYGLLVIAGCGLVLGISLARECLKSRGEKFYSTLAWVCIGLAIPVFIVNMLYWGFYLPEFFGQQAARGAADYPDWFTPMRKLFGALSVAEVSLTYAATLFLALSLRAAGLIGRPACLIYTTVSVLAAMVLVLSLYIPALDGPAFGVSIPAAPMLMPYWMGVGLLGKRVEKG